MANDRSGTAAASPGGVDMWCGASALASLSAVFGTLGFAVATFALGGAEAALVALGLGGGVGAALVLRARRIDGDRARCEARLRAAEADNLAKSLFLAEMSHELRTPLNTVMGFSEMMADEVLGPHRVPAYAGYARDILGAGRHLLALADDLLDLARIESGHRMLLETPVHLDRLGQECLGMLRPNAAARRLMLVHAVESPAALWGDERAVRQIMLNLLMNAVKFTPVGGEVRLVTGLDDAGMPFLAVEDTGPGMSDRELPLNGTRHRESRVDVTSGQGAGLGLAIVRALAGLHGGELCLARRVGGGTSARVRFPRDRALIPPVAT